jgi:hypothetical protein
MSASIVFKLPDIILKAVDNIDDPFVLELQ